MSTPWHNAPLPALADHIVQAHHAFCRREMARLTGLFQAAAHDADTGLSRLQASFQRLCRALEQHLLKEETVLFPLIAQIDAAHRDHTPPPRPSFGGVANPIRMMVLEHDEAAAVLAQMRQATGNFQPPADASPAYQELCAGLRAFDEDMRQHVALEDQVLFPRAVAAEQEALAR
ncbi:MAG TPA: hemerythrin domain-containing protein [Terriglobales bacterium]|nr:hemerythrin domain-containing protein [Terriglobales bacterium]